MNRYLCGIALTFWAGAAFAGPLEGVVQSELRTGWRGDDGVHVAAVHLRLAPGWKTYWRAPGDAGIPPLFDWSGSDNAHTVSIVWPTPHVFWQSGSRSVGYTDELVLPLRIMAADPSEDIQVNGRMDIGLCEEICLPYSLSFSATLPHDTDTRDPVIAAALVNRPFASDEAGVRSVTCRIEPTTDGAHIAARIELPRTGRSEETVIELADPQVWVSPPETVRRGGALHTEAELIHMSGDAFAVNRSDVRITVLGSDYAVDIQGCNAP